MKKEIFFKTRTIIFNAFYQLTNSLFGNSVSVLCFHSVSDGSDRYSVDIDSFKRNIDKIAQYSKFISLEQAINGTQRTGSSIVITIDDGYADILDILPTLKKHKIKATAFILSNPEIASWSELGNNHRLLSTNEVRQLIKNGVEIGCHGATHADLTKLSAKQLEKEISGSKKTLEKNLGIKIKYFAYPKGKYNKKVISVVEKAGYDAAFSINPGCLPTNQSKWILPRTIIDKTHMISEFPAVYSPSTMILRTITNKLGLWEKFLSI